MIFTCKYYSFDPFSMTGYCEHCILRNQKQCSCFGDMRKCERDPHYDNITERMTEDNLTKIYYAHHQYKYNTQVERYEFDLIRKYFPNAIIYNPSSDLDVVNRSEEEIMADCISTVRDSHVVIFSSMDGMVGKGVYTEVKEAIENDKLVLYIYKNKLITNFAVQLYECEKSNDRLYGIVNIT